MAVPRRYSMIRAFEGGADLRRALHADVLRRANDITPPGSPDIRASRRHLRYSMLRADFADMYAPRRAVSDARRSIIRHAFSASDAL